MRSFRDLPQQDASEKRLHEARSFLWRVVGVWLVAGLVLAFAAISLLVSHTAFTSAFTHNVSERKTASLMWNSYCSKPLHEVSLQQIETELGRSLDCKWAMATKDMNLVEQSVLDANIILLFNFSRFPLMQPWVVISMMGLLYLLSLVAPFLAAWYYFRETRRKIELQQKAFESKLTIAQRASLHRIVNGVTLEQ